MAKTDLPILEQRRIEANVIKSIYEEMKREIGAERAKQIIDGYRLIEIHLLRDHTIEDQRDRWRKKQAKTTGRRDEAEVKSFVIPCLLHRRIEDGTERDDGCT